MTPDLKQFGGRSTNARARSTWLAAFCCAGVFLANSAAADDVPYAEIHAQRDLGQLQIMTGYFERTPDLASRAAAMEKEGIVLLETERDRTFTRTLNLGSRQVTIAIMIAPPVGHGEGGGSSRALIRVAAGADTLVDCPLYNGPIGLDRLVIDPSRRFVSVLGSEGAFHFDGFESRRKVDEDWLDERAEAARRLLCGTGGSR